MKRLASAIVLMIAAPALSLSNGPLVSWGQVQPPRDVRRATVVGAGRITGVVRAADSEARPLRRARVMLNSDVLPVGRTAIANDEGAFAFDGLPAGRYSVAATKEGYVTMAFGARRPGRPGASIPMHNGDSRTIALRLPRGAVVTGMVVGPDGQPAPGVLMNALTSRYLPASGERRLANVASDTTDDRGIYRIFGLPAGEYVVAALPRLPTGADVQVLSDADVRRALAAVRENPTSRTRPGIAPAPPPMPPAESRRTVSLAPVYYPGTAFAARAKPIALAAGEERAGMDFQIDYVPTAIVSGTVSEAASLMLMPTLPSPMAMESARGARAGSDGRFAFAPVPPGEYTVVAGVYSAGPSPMPAGPPLVAKAAMNDVFVNGEDISSVSLALQTGLAISGRLAFEGNTSPRPPVPGIRFAMPASTGSGNFMIPFPPLQLEEDGRFTVAGIVPGVYRLGSGAQGIRTAIGGWWLKSIVVNGHELLDGDIDLKESSYDAVVTLTDRASEVSGRVTDASGNPWVDGFVVIFTVDRNAWFYSSRRIAGARPNSEGRYVVRNLPPGEYFMLAYDDIEPLEWFDPSMLEQLSPLSLRVTISEYEKRIQDVVVR